MTVARPPDVSVVVVSHDSGPTLLECVDRVLGQQGVDCELLLVDNASVDGMPGRLPIDPRIRRIDNRSNPGFAVASNQGAASARSAVLLFLNPDCLLPADALRRLLSRLADEPSLGLLGAQLLEADGSPQPASRRPLPTIARMLRPGSGHLGHLQSGVEWVEATSGALMMIPREVFQQVGGFDEGYVLHCEDLDLCRRIAAAGWRVGIDPGLRVVHLKGCSSRRRPFWVEWQKHRGMLRYLRKFETAPQGRALYPLLWLAVWCRYPLAALRAWWSARRAAGTLSR